jgi:hypothetical protein
VLGSSKRFAKRFDASLAYPRWRLDRGAISLASDGHPEIEAALVELYRQTGERRYLELAKALTERRGLGQFTGGRFAPDYYQDVEPVRESRSIGGHAVRALYSPLA